MVADPRWLILSKPLRAPLRDGTTVLAAGLVRGLPEAWSVADLGDPEAPLRRGQDRILPTSAMGYAPGLWDRARLLWALLDPRFARLPVHLFFSPNRASQGVLAAVRRVAHKRRFLQTIPASHGAQAHAQALSGLDAVVVTSEHGRQTLIDGGLSPARVHCIYPGIILPDAGAVSAPRTRITYAGDLDGAVATRLIAIAQVLMSSAHGDWRLTIACRPKGPDDTNARARLRRELVVPLAAGQVELLAEVADMDALLRSSRLQLYLADHVRNKVDLPLVILEGLARGVPLAALDRPPVTEVFELAQVEGLEVGTRLPHGGPGAVASGVMDALRDAQRLARWGEDAHALALRQFGLATMVRRYVDLYHALETSRVR